MQIQAINMEKQDSVILSAIGQRKEKDFFRASCTHLRHESGVQVATSIKHVLNV